MKKQIFSLLMLCSFITTIVCEEAKMAAVAGTTAQTPHKRKKTNFKELELIKKVDGKYGLFDAASVHESLQALSKIKAIQYGDRDKTTQKRYGTYHLGDKLVTLQDVVIEEHKLKKENVSKDDARWTALNAALISIKDDFNVKMKTLRGAKEESDMAKNIKHKLISFFLKDQNRENSLMANADLPDEKKRLYDASATEFFMFLNDLSHFLEDMIESCSEAHNQYKELVQKSSTK
jgi:hypothetical protein